MNVERIVIRFGDNDFCRAMQGLSVFLLGNDTPALPNDKEKIAFIINQVFFGCYVFYQNPFEYNGLEKMDKNYIAHMKVYLQVNAQSIFVNEEADAYMAKNRYDNGESIYIDFVNKQSNMF